MHSLDLYFYRPQRSLQTFKALFCVLNTVKKDISLINLVTSPLDPPLLSTDVEYVVASDEGITVLVLQLSVHILLCLFQDYIHVSAERVIRGISKWGLGI